MLLKKDPISTNKVQMRLQISDLNKALPPKKNKIKLSIGNYKQSHEVDPISTDGVHFSRMDVKNQAV